MFCCEQRRLDASFTWQLQGCGDVSESAEALIITRVNHCSGNPEDMEGAWGEGSQESRRLHRRRPCGSPAEECQQREKQLVRLSHYRRLFTITRWWCLYTSIHAWGRWGQQHHLLKWTISRNMGNVKPDLWSVYSAVRSLSLELGS